MERLKQFTFDNRINGLRNDIRGKIAELIAEDVEDHVNFNNTSSGVFINSDEGDKCEINAALLSKKSGYEVRYEDGAGQSRYMDMNELDTDTLNDLYKALYAELYFVES